MSLLRKASTLFKTLETLVRHEQSQQITAQSIYGEMRWSKFIYYWNQTKMMKLGNKTGSFLLLLFFTLNCLLLQTRFRESFFFPLEFNRIRVCKNEWKSQNVINGFILWGKKGSNKTLFCILLLWDLYIYFIFI